MIKVVLADDQALLRESIGYILDNDDEITVVGTAKDGEEAIALCKSKQPDVILMDIEMPVMNGVKAAKVIKEQFPKIKVMILTTFENSDNIMESFIVGADGYIVKDISHTELVLAVKCTFRGLCIIHHSVKKMMMERFKSLCDYKSKYEDLLNDKELRIVRLVAEGKSNKEIAASMNYSEGTIKNYITKILEKLEVSDRMQIAVFAIENGIV